MERCIDANPNDVGQYRDLNRFFPTSKFFDLRYAMPPTLALLESTLAGRRDAESGSKTCSLGSTGARRVGKFVHAISSANLRLRGMGIKLLSRSCAWRMQMHLMVWLDGLEYCMLFSKHFLTGIYSPVNTLINARQGPRDD